MHFHCSPTVAVELELRAGDDAANVCWLDVDDEVPEFRNLYANHKHMVELALKQVPVLGEFLPESGGFE